MQAHPAYIIEILRDLIAFDNIKRDYSILWQIFWIIYNVNKDTLFDYELASIFLYWLLLPENVLNKFISARLHELEYATEFSKISAELDFIKKVGSIQGEEDFNACRQWLRKFSSL